jgi:carbamoyl-phosphate synthase large subunit
VDLIKDGKIDIVFNTPYGRESFYDDSAIRKSATMHGVLCVTTLTGAVATARALKALKEENVDVVSLQEIHAGA